MQNKIFIPPEKLSSKSFTLIELIVVIIIVGILAAVGMTQYSSVTEKARGAEARAIIGDIRNYAHEYYLQNGTLTGMTNADVNIGSGANQIPVSCRSSHYFSYSLAEETCSGTSCYLYAYRCTSGGKTPNYATGGYIVCNGDYNLWGTKAGTRSSGGPWYGQIL